MNEYLAAFYGTADHSTEDQEKVAQAEMFAKLAAAEGIDLNTLNEDQVAYLWNQVFVDKTAGKEEHGHGHGHKEKEEPKEEDKDKKAAAEFAEKRAASEKVAEADFLGRVMAHAYVQELSNIGEAKTAGHLSDAAASVGKAVKGGAEAVKGFAKHHAGDAGAAGAVKRTAKGYGRAMTGADIRHYGDEAKKNFNYGLSDSSIKNLRGEAIKKTVGAHAATAGVVGAGAAGAAAASKDKKKKASAFEEKAAEYAVVMATNEGYDQEEVTDKVAALLVLGLADSEKVAAAADLETGLQIRALEMLETIGVPVTWNE
jgi:hypothetical protein